MSKRKVKKLKLEQQVNKNTKDINRLKTENAVQNNKIDNLCLSIDRLVNSNQRWFYFAVVKMVAVVGFIIKYTLF